MKHYIGIDLGTSAMKLILLREDGVICNTVSKEYPIAFPKPGWSEQNPEDWKAALLAGVPELIRGMNPLDLAGIGCGGQMHGLVALDEQDQVVRPAILWNDGRCGRQTDWLNHEIGTEKLMQWVSNIAFAGFTAPKLLWMKEEEPENFARIRKIMLPKDYINYILTGVHATDYSDAAGTLLLDVAHRCWSAPMLEICGVNDSQLPKLFESYEPIGTVKEDLAASLGIPAALPVAAGAADNAAAAIGMGVVGDGGCNISLGTSGTIFLSSEGQIANDNPALHIFAHADGGNCLLGCMLSAASCNRWFMEDILKTDDYAAEQSAITEEKLGCNPVYFLPYLMGERSPINDVNARGVFFGMTMDTSRADLLQAILEGVAFAIRDSVEIAVKNGLLPEKSKICGGGAKSPLWRKIFAAVLNLPLEIPENEQGPGIGAALLAEAAGTGANIRQLSREYAHTSETVLPDPILVERYEKRYQQFRKIYPACRELFTEFAKEQEV